MKHIPKRKEQRERNARMRHALETQAARERKAARAASSNGHVRQESPASLDSRSTKR